MSIKNFFKSPTRRRPICRRPPASRLYLETLEDRCLLSFSPAVNYPVGVDVDQVLTADINGDGRLDLAVASAYTNTVNILLGKGDGTFQAAQNFATGNDPHSLAVGDFNGDGKLDVVTLNWYDTVAVLLGNGDGTFQPAKDSALSVLSQVTPLAVGDLNGDGKLDLVATSYGSIYVLLGHGDGTFAAATSQLLGNSSPHFPVLQDFNADGKLDLAMTDPSFGKLSVLLGHGDGTFGAPAYYTTYNVQSVVIGDVNGDGISDLITRNSSSPSALLGNGSASVLLGNGSAGVGDGTFQPAKNIALNGDPNSLAVGDFNADGKLDLVVASTLFVIDGYDSYGYLGHNEGQVNVLFGHGDGTFSTPRTSSVEGSYFTSVATGDFNGDGFSDVAVKPSYTFNVSVLLNTGDWRSFVVSGFPSPTTAGEAHSITVTAWDNFGNPLTSYAGTVHFSSSDTQAILPADYTFTAGDHGTHTFSVILKTAGTQSLTVTDTTSGGFDGSQGGIVVNAAAMSSIVLAGFPSKITSGYYGSFGVTGTDAYGNGATGTIHFTSSDGSAMLPADYTLTGSVYGFYAILPTVGTQSITVTATAAPSVTSTQAGIRVVPGASISGPDAALRNQTLTFTLGASGMPAGTVFSFAIDWNNDGIVDQTVSGPSGTTVQHSFAVSGWYYIGVTATANVGGQDYTSFSANRYVAIFAVTVTVQADPGDATKSALVVQDTADAGYLVLSPGAGNAIALSVSGYSVGSYSAPGGAAFGHLLVYGYGGDDMIQLTGGLAVPALLFGGDGNDTLDASGSIANNVQVGGAGDDGLYGGSGRDLLIGGLGADAIRAGSGGAILIGGYTDYDANVQALLAIMKEWSRTDADYNTRVKHLNGSLSGGLNGSYFLNATTVHNDAAIDSLFGGAGMDWFFVGGMGKQRDKLYGQAIGEVLTKTL